jgi:hypothetical protein
LSEQLQEIGLRLTQTDLYHSPGHGPYFVNSCEVCAKRRAPDRADRLLQCRPRRIAGQRGLVWPGSVSQTENVAQAIVRDDPAVG